MAFEIDTGQTQGAIGPFMNWTSNGSAMKGFPPKSWVLRGKDENDEKFERVIEGFASDAGCVMDLDTLQLGWMKDGATGQAPEKRWNPSVSQATQRPDESKKQSGAYAWSQALSIRCAIGGGQALMPSTVTLGGPGRFIDLPLGHKDESWSFDHIDTLSIAVSDAPCPNEILVCVGMADGARFRARVGKGPR